MKRLKTFKLEPVIFLSMVLFSIIPILIFKHFTTLDGPAHLYNSNLLGHLLTGDNFIENYFLLNSFSTPNWLGHILILGFQRIFGSVIAEKIIVIICIAGLAYSFRFLVKTLNPTQIFTCYLIFPFTYSFFLFLGFFNFIISVSLLFVSIALFVKLFKRFTFYIYILTIISLLLTYFAHPFGFLAFLLSAGVYTATTIYTELSRRNIKRSLQLTFIALSIILIPCILYVDYAGKNLIALTNERLNVAELIRWIYRLRSLVVFNFGKEQLFTTTIFAVITALILLVVYKKISHNNSIVQKQGNSLINTTWLISGIVILILYFTMPNQINSGGYVSDRLNFLFFIFLIIWISTFTWNKQIIIIACTITLICHIGLLNYYTKQISWLNSYSKSIYTSTKKIEPNSIILPVGTPPDWMLGHITNYIGADKKVLILENYEAFTGYFPLLWNWAQIPNLKVGENNLNQICVNSFQLEFDQTVGKKVDYIIFTGKFNVQIECKTRLDSIITNSYNEIYTSTDSTFRLFKLLNK